MLFGRPTITKNWKVELGEQCLSCLGTSTYAVIMERRELLTMKKIPGMVCTDCYSAFEFSEKKIRNHVVDLYDNKITKEEFSELVKK